MAEEIINLTATHRSQTKGLAVETWQQIFWDASYIEGFEEFTTRAGAHNRLEWDNKSGKPGAARVPEEAFEEALKTRRKITLVCKAWYAMGIEILYSHLRIRCSQWLGSMLPRLSRDCRHLLRYTMRLAVKFDQHEDLIISKPSELIRKLTWLCSDLTRLKIIEVPGQLSLCPFPNLPTTLEVALFDARSTFPVDRWDNTLHPFPDAWTNVRILDIQIRSLKFCLSTDPVVFPVLEDLHFQETLSYFGMSQLEKEPVIRYIGSKWTAPKLKSLTIRESTWPLWYKFFRRHSETLTTLCLFDAATGYGYEGESEDLELPNLRNFYYDWDEIPPDGFIANGVERIGIHDLRSLRSFMERLPRVFGVWRSYPNITSCCLSGLGAAMKPLEKEPKVIEFVAEMKEKGITVDFIHLDKYPGY
jgi:hypothetical protein